MRQLALVFVARRYFNFNEQNIPHKIFESKLSVKGKNWSSERPQVKKMGGGGGLQHGAPGNG